MHIRLRNEPVPDARMLRITRYEIVGQLSPRWAQQRHAQCAGSGRLEKRKEKTNWHSEFCISSIGTTYGTRASKRTIIRFCRRNRSAG